MPSTSPKQARFMNIIAHSAKFAREVGVPQKVGRDFHAADKAAGQYFPAKKVQDHHFAFRRPNT